MLPPNRFHLLLVAAVATFVAAGPLAACDVSSTPPLPPLGAPLTVPANTWTWVAFPDAVCDDNSSTGIGINWNGSKDLLIFMTGGGACWDYTTCFLLNSSTHGPFQEADFFKMQGELPGSILDRTLPGNPFADYNLVFIPYCTGDVHSGDNVATYSEPGVLPRQIYHKGRANLVAYLSRLAATLPAPDKLVVSGASAGGFGSVLNYDLFRSYFPAAKESYMLDDSGPAFSGDDIPSFFRSAWWASWDLGASLGVLCPACQDDFSRLLPILSSKYPLDRMALLSHTQDSVIRTFFLLTPADFQTDLYSLAGTVIDPLPNMHYYIEDGTTHTFLGQPGQYTSQGVKLLDWLQEQATDSPLWSSIKPPN